MAPCPPLSRQPTKVPIICDSRLFNKSHTLLKTRLTLRRGCHICKKSSNFLNSRQTEMIFRKSILHSLSRNAVFLVFRFLPSRRRFYNFLYSLRKTLIFHQNVPYGLIGKTVYQNFEIRFELRLRANLVLIL